eukprot:TRINITY_DN66985_c5_g1_i1.p1 TRINITY_DN66985_c5_g1~~TRINITY_DN66985_c5_g1_i1.p1  ORF type:complete len:265 (+),score=21.65 TRINITY_DN66985_c5_g1_i1:37-831(+)
MLQRSSFRIFCTKRVAFHAWAQAEMNQEPLEILETVNKVIPSTWDDLPTFTGTGTLSVQLPQQHEEWYREQYHRNTRIYGTPHELHGTNQLPEAQAAFTTPIIQTAFDVLKETQQQHPTTDQQPSMLLKHQYKYEGGHKTLRASGSADYAFLGGQSRRILMACTNAPRNFTWNQATAKNAAQLWAAAQHGGGVPVRGLVGDGYRFQLTQHDSENFKVGKVLKLEGPDVGLEIILAIVSAVKAQIAGKARKPARLRLGGGQWGPV